MSLQGTFTTNSSSEGYQDSSSEESEHEFNPRALLAIVIVMIQETLFGVTTQGEARRDCSLVARKSRWHKANGTLDTERIAQDAATKVSQNIGGPRDDASVRMKNPKVWVLWVGFHDRGMFDFRQALREVVGEDVIVSPSVFKLTSAVWRTWLPYLREINGISELPERISNLDEVGFLQLGEDPADEMDFSEDEENPEDPDFSMSSSSEEEEESDSDSDTDSEEEEEDEEESDSDSDFSDSDTDSDSDFDDDFPPSAMAVQTSSRSDPSSSRKKVLARIATREEELQQQLKTLFSKLDKLHAQRAALEAEEEEEVSRPQIPRSSSNRKRFEEQRRTARSKGLKHSRMEALRKQHHHHRT